MPKSKPAAHIIANERKQMLASLNNMRPHDDGHSNSEESEEEDADATRLSDPPLSQPLKRSQSKSNKKALPLTIGPHVINMNFKDTVMSPRSYMAILKFGKEYEPEGIHHQFFKNVLTLLTGHH